MDIRNPRMTTLILPTPDGFKFLPVIWSHGWYQLPPFSFDEGTRTLGRLQALPDGRIVSLAIRSETDDSTLHIVVDGLDATPTTAQAETIKQVVTRILSLDWDLSGFYAAMREHLRYHWAERSSAGRILIGPTVWEDLAKTLLTTNTTWSQTKAMCARLCALGQPHGDDGHAFPTPEAIALLSVDELGERIRAGYRSAYLHELATRIVEGDVDVETWYEDDLSGDELYKAVKSLKGFGDYAAGTMLRLLGRFDRLAIDTECRAAYKSMTGSDSATDKELHAYYEAFGEWRGLAAWMDVMRDWLEQLAQ
jgi:N-glycosylase/DNA lyase